MPWPVRSPRRAPRATRAKRMGRMRSCPQGLRPSFAAAIDNFSRLRREKLERVKRFELSTFTLAT